LNVSTRPSRFRISDTICVLLWIVFFARKIFCKKSFSRSFQKLLYFIIANRAYVNARQTLFFCRGGTQARPWQSQPEQTQNASDLIPKDYLCPEAVFITVLAL